MGANRLINARSPYLLQHARNPVHWHEWGDEALKRARDEGKPILVSIGYSACHWCHVMERESFENETIAALMNDHFVCIKVDREERPDLDDLYMTAAQMLTGGGGWPLNVFLTPDLKPFFAGTYFPPDDRWGRPGFPSVLRRVADVYRKRRSEIEEAADRLVDALSQSAFDASEGAPSYGLIEQAVEELSQAFDETWGGFGGAPKFPGATTIELLLRHHHRSGDARALEMATLTLDHMAQGGMYDQLGGGFHRYSVDEQWLVPHFEKMLYDNALLADAYLQAYQTTGRADYARVAAETLDYVLRDMSDAAGGFHSATDADSEGEEGRYFVWDLAEVQEVLGGEDAGLFADYYDVTAQGNFEGHNILHVAVPLEEFAASLSLDAHDLRERLDAMRGKLLARRYTRVPPATDDKVLADWNALTISALARGYQVLGDARYREAAERAARFILDHMRADGKLLHAYRGGESYVDAYLDDHAFLLQGLLDLYEATFDVAWIARARETADDLIEGFWDAEGGGFFLTREGRADLVARPKSSHDGATPSGSAVAAAALLRLGRLTGDEAYGKVGEATVRALAGPAARMPRAFPALLCALDSLLAPPTEIVIAGAAGDRATTDLIAAASKTYLPNRTIAALDPEAATAGAVRKAIPLTEGKCPVNGRPAAYVCNERGCLPPVLDASELAGSLGLREPCAIGTRPTE
jgi:uncharacterized protein YyaL (SSP411 family)